MDVDELFDGFKIRIFVHANPLDYEACLIELPFIMGKGSTSTDSVFSLKNKWENYKKECLEKGGNIPIPLSKQEFSGQFNTRIDTLLHKTLAIEASERGMSLNNLVSQKLRDSMVREKLYIDKIDIERSKVRNTITLYFMNSLKETVGLTFTECNLNNELGKLSDSELIVRISSSSFKKSVEKFINSHIFMRMSISGFPMIDCALVHIKASDLLDHDEFLICNAII